MKNRFHVNSLQKFYPLISAPSHRKTSDQRRVLCPDPRRRDGKDPEPEVDAGVRLKIFRRSLRQSLGHRADRLDAPGTLPTTPNLTTIVFIVALF